MKIFKILNIIYQYIIYIIMILINMVKKNFEINIYKTFEKQCNKCYDLFYIKDYYDLHYINCCK